MDVYKYLPGDAENYIQCFRMLAALIYTAMDEVEKTRDSSEEDKARQLQRVADGVETIACLRGDSGLFYAARPRNLTLYQNEMYQIENLLRTRLVALGYSYPKDAGIR